MSSNAAVFRLRSKVNKQPSGKAGVQASTRSLFFTAWTAVDLLGRSPQQWVTDDNIEMNDLEHSSKNAWSINRIRRVTERFALTAIQQVAIDRAVGQLQPLIVRLRSELGETQQRLASLRSEHRYFLEKTGSLSNDIGCLAAQLALTSRQMKTDVCAILTAEQNGLLGELQRAFEMHERI